MIYRQREPLIKFTPKGIYCPTGDFYIDPMRPVSKALITHAHADHARWGMKKYIAHKFTKSILHSRLSEPADVQGVEYDEVLSINGVKVSFHPAGHVIGSAQIRLEYRGFVTVISGDYKLENDGISTPFEPIRCHEFVSESTFGLPIYRWDPQNVQKDELKRWVELNQKQGKTSVFVGYSLGKAQRLMKMLEGSGQLFVHRSIGALNEAFRNAGVVLPDYTEQDFFSDLRHLEGKIVLVPPALLDSNVIKKIPNAAVGLCSGWMRVRGSRRWRSADRGFAISDHADWQGLIRAVALTEAQHVYVTHGQTEVFARYLRETGISASAVPVFGNSEKREEEAQVD